MVQRVLAAGIAFALAVAALTSIAPPLLGAEEEEIDLERTIRLEAELLSVESVPTRATRAIARYRVTSRSYNGAVLSIAYDFTRPVRLRSWDVHDQGGYRRIGGAIVADPALGQWDSLFPRGSDRPAEAIVVRLIQHDLNEDEERRRWHFKRMETIEPVHRDELPVGTRDRGFGDR